MYLYTTQDNKEGRALLLVGRIDCILQTVKIKLTFVPLHSVLHKRSILFLVVFEMGPKYGSL